VQDVELEPVMKPVGSLSDSGGVYADPVLITGAFDGDMTDLRVSPVSHDPPRSNRKLLFPGLDDLPRAAVGLPTGPPLPRSPGEDC
jgi:hypothetical protein